MPKPVLGSQILQDTFENLKTQAGDVTQGLKDLTTGDSGIEQLGGQQDPKQQAQPTQQPGFTPQQLMEKRAKEEQDRQFHQGKIKEWEDHFLQMKKGEEEGKKRQQAEEDQKKEQEIIQLQEEQAKTAVLQGPAKPKQGRGTAFLPPSAKQSMGTGELSKTPTN